MIWTSTLPWVDFLAAWVLWSAAFLPLESAFVGRALTRWIGLRRFRHRVGPAIRVGLALGFGMSLTLLGFFGADGAMAVTVGLLAVVLLPARGRRTEAVSSADPAT